MNEIERPMDEEELAAVLREAATHGRQLEVVGNGSKRAMGRPVQAAAILSSRNLRGITLYEPNELVISALAGTPLTVIENELARNNQQLVFEPIDLGPMLGGEAGQGTIGGVVATNLSGSRRVYSGAVRDHVLGIRAVNGRGELFKSGGRVMKNVTGYDLCRGMTGSWGTLGVMSEVTLKVLPKPEEVRTMVLFDQPDVISVEMMCAAMGLPYDVSAALHLQAPLAARLACEELREAGTSVTLLRIENFSSSVRERAEKMRNIFAAYGELIELDHPKSVALWNEIRRLSFLQGSTDPVWRISTAPTVGPQVVNAISGYIDCRVAYDWSGGLLWIEVPNSVDAGAADIRRVIATRGGHATLVRADLVTRAAVEVFQPLEHGVARLTSGIKAAFDPARILNPGRMYAEV